MIFMIRNTSEYIKKHTYCLYIILAALQLVFMFYQCGKQSMWLDEMSFLGTITKDKSCTDILWQYLSIDVTNLPLFPLITAVWYRIMPANDRLMLLLPELFAAGSLVVVSLLTEKRFGKRAGITASVLMLISCRSILNCGFELRAYALMLFLSSLLLLLHFERNDSIVVNIKLDAAYGVSLLLLLFTHYSGAILIAILGITDLVRILCKQIKITSLIPYVAAGVLFSPWFIMMLLNKQKSIGSFWTDPPTVPEIARTLKYLLSENEAIYVVFIVTVLIVCFGLTRGLHKSQKNLHMIIDAAEMTAVIFAMIMGVFIYSAVINPGGGFFLKRYFLVLLPLMIAVTSFGIIYIQDFILEGKDEAKKYELMFVVIAFILIYFGFINLAEIRETSGTSWETFREAAAYVREQGVLNDDGNAALVCSVNPRATAGFAEYYVRRGGREKEINTVSLQGDDPVTEISKYDRIYLVYVHKDLENLDPLIKETLTHDFKPVSEDENVKAAVYERIRNTPKVIKN